jgi:hypothetical protein
LRENRYESATQLQLNFSPPTPVHLTAIPQYPSWRDVTDIARSAGFSGNCQVSTDLYEQLDEQALYDALWTASFTLSLNGSEVVHFTLELGNRFIQFKAIQTNGAVHVGRADDF